MSSLHPPPPDEDAPSGAQRHDALLHLAATALDLADPAALTATAASVLVSGCDAEHADVLLLTSARDALRAPGAKGVTEAVEPGGQASFVLAREEPVVVEDLRTESRFEPAPALVRAGRRAGIDVALRRDSDALGIVRVYRTRPGPWDAATVAFVTSAAELIRAALVRMGDLADEQRRFRALVESVPDAVLMSDADGRVQDANLRATELLDDSLDELYGRHLGELFEDASFLEHDAPGSPTTSRVTRPDGSVVPVDVTTTRLDEEHDLARIIFVRDARRGPDRHAAARQAGDVGQHHVHAFAMNDDVVQGLAAARYALDEDDITAASRALDATIVAVRSMIADLLEEGVDSAGLEPGDLVRRSAPRGAGLHGEPYAALDPGVDGDLDALEALLEQPSPARSTVVLADDADDVRGLVRALLIRGGYDVVAEARDGRAAVDAVDEHEPDVLVVDLAMPRLDGFEVIGLVRDDHPDTKILALSGFDREHVSDRALAAGADAYVEKGGPTDKLLNAISALCETHDAAPVDDDRGDEPVLSRDALAVVVHELRTPLTVVRGMLETLQTRIDQLPSATVTGMLETARRNCDQLEHMLDAFADASIIASGGLSVHHERIDLAALARESVADIGTIHRDHDITTDAPPRLELEGDPVRLRQVLANLLSNAAKYSRPGSRISVAVRTSANGARAEVAVTDAGIGIPQGQAEKVFDRFERLGRSGRGSGLGLYVSRGIAWAHDGDLRIARSDETGTTFVLELPVRTPARAESARSREDD